MTPLSFEGRRPTRKWQARDDGHAIRTILEEPAPFDPRGDDRE